MRMADRSSAVRGSEAGERVWALESASSSGACCLGNADFAPHRARPRPRSSKQISQMQALLSRSWYTSGRNEALTNTQVNVE